METVLATDRTHICRSVYLSKSEFVEAFVAQAQAELERIAGEVRALQDDLSEVLAQPFVEMENKEVCFCREAGALIPNLRKHKRGGCSPSSSSASGWPEEKIDEFSFQAMSETQCNVVWRKANGNPYMDSDGCLRDECRTDDVKHRCWVVGGNGYRFCSCGNAFCNDSPPYYDGFVITIHPLHCTGNPCDILYCWLKENLLPTGLSEVVKAKFNTAVTYIRDLAAYITVKDAKELITHLDQFAAAVHAGAFKDTVNDVCFDLEGTWTEVSEQKRQYSANPVSLRAKLLECDYKRANIAPYEPELLTDSKKGHWELFEALTNEEYRQDKPEMQIAGEAWWARPPQMDVDEDAVCAIDFGTKSTVVACRFSDHDLRRTEERLLRIGTDDYNKMAQTSHYENPTVVALRDVQAFIDAYQARKGRPQTEWNQLEVSHSAAQLFTRQGDDSEVYCSLFDELKQWAIGAQNTTFLTDTLKKYTLELKPYLMLQDGEFDPIEVYAYYLGLYINNMHQGRIILRYIMSFPVKVKDAVKSRIRESFEKGLRKSLPQAILRDEKLMQVFSVSLRASEPAAYAACALSVLGLEPKDECEEVAYGVFDFGGGTTDFDFGVEKRGKRSLFEIEQFGYSGDELLGGENILNLMAYQVYKDNLQEMRKKRIPFVVPPQESPLPDAEGLLCMAGHKASMRASMNVRRIAELVRPIWESSSPAGKVGEQLSGAETVAETAVGADDGTAAAVRNSVTTDAYSTGKQSLRLFSLGRLPDATQAGAGASSNASVALDIKAGASDEVNIELSIDEKKLVDKVIRPRIKRGVDNFFVSMWRAFEGRKTYPINILLAGNSCRSPLVKELFKQKMKDDVRRLSEELQRKDGDMKGMESALELHLPLGMNEGEPKAEYIDTQRTGKTGVVFGLLRNRPGGKDVRIINKNVDETNEVLFPYLLGESDFQGNFHVVVGPGVKKNVWVKLAIVPDEDRFELCYTKESRALDERIPINEVQSKSLPIKPEDCINDDGAHIYIRKAGPDTVEYTAALDTDMKQKKSVPKEKIYSCNLEG